MNLYFLRFTAEFGCRLWHLRETLSHNHNCIDLIFKYNDFKKELDPSLSCWADNKGVVFIFLPDGNGRHFHPFYENNERLLLDYKGKIVILTDGDDSYILEHIYHPPVMASRIDAFVALNRSPDTVAFDIADKVVLLPRFTIPNDVQGHSRFERKGDIKKIKKMIFYGGPDISRIEAIKRIKNSNLNKYFEGGVCPPIPNLVGEGHMSNLPDEEYYKDLVVNQEELNPIGGHYRIDGLLYWDKLCESLISLCGTRIMGTWTYRFVESMAASCAIISAELDLPIDQDFLYRDKVLDLFFTFKRDFSDFLDVCQYCLDHESECIERGKEGYEVYKKYWEVNEDGSYKDNVWRDIQAQFLELNIDI